MRELNVFISEKDKRGFIRRALRRYKKSGHEHIEGAIVRVGLGQYHIEKLVPLEAKAGMEDGLPYVIPDETDYNAKKAAAEANGLKFITLHSHPDCGSEASKTDHIGAIQDGEVLMGVLDLSKNPKTGRFQTCLDFWVPQLPCKVNVIKS